MFLNTEKHDEIMTSIVESMGKNESGISDEWSVRMSKVRTSDEKDAFLKELNEAIESIENIKQEDIQSFVENTILMMDTGVQEFSNIISQNLAHLKGLYRRADRKPVVLSNPGTSLDSEEESIEEGVRSFRSQRARERFLLQEEAKRSFNELKEKNKEESKFVAPKKLVSERQKAIDNRKAYYRWIQEAANTARMSVIVQAIYEALPFDQEIKTAKKDQFLNEIEDFLKNIPSNGKGSQALGTLIEIGDSVIGHYDEKNFQDNDMEDIKDRTYAECEHIDDVKEILNSFGIEIKDRVLNAFTSMREDHQKLEDDIQRKALESDEIRENIDYYKDRWDRKRKLSFFESLMIANSRILAKKDEEIKNEEKEKKFSQDRVMEETIFQYTMFESVNALGLISEKASDIIRVRLLHI